MPHQLGVTILAPVAAGRVAELRDWLAGIARKGLAEGPFGFSHLHGLHFAKLYLLDETADLDGRPMPATLVFMSEVDAPQRRHLAELVDLAGEGIDQAFGHCTGYPGPGAGRRDRIDWLRRRMIPASAFYVNTVGRGLEQIRQEARLRDALEESVPLVLMLLLPLLVLVLPVRAVLLRLAERHDQPFTRQPTWQHLEEVAGYEDFTTQNPFAVAGFVRPGRLRQLTFRAVMFLTDYGVRHIFDRDNLAGIRTIHFARWVPLDGWRRMIFASNYDGAVEAYNDDFINIVWWGLNATFSNGMDYPPTALALPPVRQP